VKTLLKTAFAILPSVLFFFLLAQPSLGATTNVLVGPGATDTFSPSAVSISVNDSVIWNWQGSFHSTTSGTNGVHSDDNGVPSGLWDSGIASTPHFFTNTFTSTGVFAYYCSFHYSFGMLGQVTVSSATTPPTLSITNPPNGTVFAEPANVTIKASVTNGSAAVTNVQFLVNNNLLASLNSGPYTAATNDLAAGAYTISAIAQDNNGRAATNSVTITVVTPAIVSFMNSSHPSDTDFQFAYSADIGLKYVVERSSDLMNWTPLATSKATNNPAIFDDSNATNELYFYRVGRLPNP
jgi:plastocyanin